jgi:hypothetical protein
LKKTTAVMISLAEGVALVEVAAVPKVRIALEPILHVGHTVGLLLHVAVQKKRKRKRKRTMS